MDRDVEAMSIIFYNIEPMYQTSIEGSATSRKMWSRLQLEHQNIAVANATQLLGKFHQYRMDPNHTVTAHFNRLRQMSEELKSINTPVPDEVLTMRILQTLPPSYGTFRTVWNNVSIYDPSLTNLAAKLVEEEQQLKVKNNGVIDPADVAFFATHPSKIQQQQQQQLTDDAKAVRGGHNEGRGSNKNNGHRYEHRDRSSNSRSNHRDGKDYKNGDRNRRGNCYYCGRPGHKECACRDRKADERKEARHDNHNKRRDGDSDSRDNNSFACLSSLCFVTRKPTDWYADSGATYHMTDQRSFFTTFKEVPPGTWKVNGVGNAQLDTLGIGNIPIHSFVHGEKNEGELRDVLYVPGLGTNLFSIGIATDAGVNVNFTKDKVDFIKNNKKIMSGQRAGKSLYHLKVIARNANQVTTAAAVKTFIPANPMKSEGEMPKTRYPYREAVGALLYLALSTRPDISHAVSQIAKHCQNPDATHWEAVIQILAYLKGTKDLGIWLGGKQDGIVGYSDADFAGDINDRSSTSGNIFLISSGPVAWSSKKQPCIALSTTEAEYVATCEATKTAVWLRCLLQDSTEEKKIKVDYVATKDQLADIFTKPLPGPVFTKMKKRIGAGRATE